MNSDCKSYIKLYQLLCKIPCKKLLPKKDRERELAKKPSTEILQQDCIPFVIYWSALLRVGDREDGGESRGGEEEGWGKRGEGQGKGKEEAIVTTELTSYCPPLPPSVTQALILFQLNTNLGRACSN